MPSVVHRCKNGEQTSAKKHTQSYIRQRRLSHYRILGSINKNPTERQGSTYLHGKALSNTKTLTGSSDGLLEPTGASPVYYLADPKQKQGQGYSLESFLRRSSLRPLRSGVLRPANENGYARRNTKPTTDVVFIRNRSFDVHLV